MANPDRIPKGNPKAKRIRASDRLDRYGRQRLRTLSNKHRRINRQRKLAGVPPLVSLTDGSISSIFNPRTNRYS